MDRKVIDSEGLDDHFFMALTKHFLVDHPSRCQPAHRALDECHGSPQKTKRDAIAHIPSVLWLWFVSLSGDGQLLGSLCHRVDQFLQDTEVRYPGQRFHAV